MSMTNSPWKLVPATDVIDEHLLYTPASAEEGSGIACAHCGGEALGYATVSVAGHYKGTRSVRVCHHETRDCYKAITVWGETLGHPAEHRVWTLY
jgi:hypothetical protein